MADACVFCRILGGDAPAEIVLETEHTIAFRDIRPLTPGHTLVIPRIHEPSVTRLPAEISSAMWQSALTLSSDFQRRHHLPADGVSFWLADGTAAGQEVPHAHLHVLPRTTGDGVRLRKVTPSRG